MVGKITFGIAASVATGLLVSGGIRLREAYRSWGVRTEDVARDLPGDDIVGDPRLVETRSLSIGAGPSDVWPWLVQMGYGRGGWYSFDRFDIRGRSADEVKLDLQQLAVGDIVPTHPGGGFRVAALEPERSLVLYLDTALVHEQATEWAARAEAKHDMPTTPGLAMAGAVGDVSMPEFKATWALVLEAEGEDRTRLIERFRVWTPEPTAIQRLGLPVMGYGVFLMTRRHMQGIRDRAERLARGGSTQHRPSSGPAGEPAPA